MLRHVTNGNIHHGERRGQHRLRRPRSRRSLWMSSRPFVDGAPRTAPPRTVTRWDSRTRASATSRQTLIRGRATARTDRTRRHRHRGIATHPWHPRRQCGRCRPETARLPDCPSRVPGRCRTVMRRTVARFRKPAARRPVTASPPGARSTAPERGALPRARARDLAAGSACRLSRGRIARAV